MRPLHGCRLALTTSFDETGFIKEKTRDMLLIG